MEGFAKWLLMCRPPEATSDALEGPDADVELVPVPDFAQEARLNANTKTNITENAFKKNFFIFVSPS